MYPERNANGNYEDHESNEFRSASAMARHWGLTYSAFSGRMENGMDLKTALETPMRGNKTWEDHLGKPHASARAMAEAWGITQSALYCRLKAGKSMEEALTSERQEKSTGPCLDHTGRPFKNAAEMARHWGLEPYIVSHRIHRNGWSLEKALTTPVHTDECSDHLGGTYPSIQAMLDEWGVCISTYHAKRRKGVPLKEILEAESRKTSPCRDGCGHAFPSKLAMAMYWHASPSIFAGLRPEEIRPENLHWRVGKARGNVVPITDYGPFILAAYAGEDYMLTREGFHALLCRDALERLGTACGPDPRGEWLAYVLREGARNSRDRLNGAAGPAGTPR